MNIESVKGRITAMEAAGDLSIKEQFYLEAMKELLTSREQVKQLAAENAGLKSCAEFYSAGFSPVKGTFGLEWKPTEKLLDDCGNVASEALNTPATDSAIASLRAEGVEMLSRHLNDWVKDMRMSPDERFMQSEISDACEEFAAQLRSQSAPSPEVAAIARQFEQVKGVQS